MIGGPWQDRKDYASFALMMYERMKRNDSPELQKRFRKAVLDSAEVYMSINPETVERAGRKYCQRDTAHACRARADWEQGVSAPSRSFRSIGGGYVLDDTSPPKFTSQDNFTRSNR